MNRLNAISGRRLAFGFTLIEVMAALIIVALGMMAVIQAVSQTASNNAYLREKSVAHWVALNRITEMRLAPQAPPVEETSGEVEMAGVRWRWSAQVTATQIVSLRRIDVSVGRADEQPLTDGDSNKLAVLTGFYGDKIAKPGTVIADFAAPPVAPGQGQPNPQGQPGNIVKPPPPPDSDVVTP